MIALKENHFHFLFFFFFLRQDSSRQLTEQKAEEVGPEGLLYVTQREYAGTSPDDGNTANTIIGMSK